MDRLGDLTAQMRRMEHIADFTRYCWVMLQPGGLSEAARLAEKMFRSERISAVLKAAVGAGTSTTSGFAGELVYAQLTAEWMSLLSTRTLLGRLNFRRVLFNTKTLKEVNPGSAGWVGEGA